jgi:DNA-binding HxlR family transcriptional regulator
MAAMSSDAGARLLPGPRLAASGAARALALIGDAWVLRILRSAFRGTCRFSTFVQELGVSRAVLSQRLDALCDAGVLARDMADGVGHARYRLTDMGLDLWGVLILMWLWERQRGTGLQAPESDGDRPRRVLLHRDCGASIEPRYVCMCCHEPVSAFQTEAVIAEPGTPEPVPESVNRRYRQSSRQDLLGQPRLLRLYGDRWNGFIMAAAFQGVRTFSDFQRALDLGPAQLSDRLAQLQALGFLRARAYAGQRQEYRLTADAVSTYPITVALMQWGNRWLWSGRAPLTLRHKSCGHPLHAELVCSHCDQALSRRNLLLRD